MSSAHTLRRPARRSPAWTAVLLLFCHWLGAQDFYFGADLSYVNELEDCGLTYFEGQDSKDPYAIFRDHGCNLVRLRLWHTPSWYDTLNNGERYGDPDDVKKAIARAKTHGMSVLLAFHLSDNWADPSSQLAPQAWQPVVADIPVLQDSLYNYLFGTLSQLYEEGLLPEMIQIGNETNKGILLSPEDNAGWTLDWPRNAALFNTALQAVTDVEQLYDQEIRTLLHLAGPENTEWLIDSFAANGVTDFEAIGISYYWSWHQPTGIDEVQGVVAALREQYPAKEVLIVETGYPWTTDWNDNANNILGLAHPDYAPPSPENQRQWLIDLTRGVLEGGGKGVIYWEPAWQSSPCFTQWGQGSHYENATFFDFDDHLLLPGGIEWMAHDYGAVSVREAGRPTMTIPIHWDRRTRTVTIGPAAPFPARIRYAVIDALGRELAAGSFAGADFALDLTRFPAGIYWVRAVSAGSGEGVKKISLFP